MSLVFWNNEKVTRSRESISTLGAITSLKEMELKEDNFQSVPETVMITDIFEGNSVKARKPSDKVPEYADVPEEKKPFHKVVVTALDYDRLEEINKNFENNREVAEAMVQNFRKFEFTVKNSLKGVEAFLDVIEQSRDQAKKKGVDNPALLLKGCKFAFIPLWDMSKSSFSGVEVVLKSVERLEVIEEVTLNNEEDKPESVENVSGLFD